VSPEPLVLWEATMIVAGRWRLPWCRTCAESVWIDRTDRVLDPQGRLVAVRHLDCANPVVWPFEAEGVNA